MLPYQCLTYVSSGTNMYAIRNQKFKYLSVKRIRMLFFCVYRHHLVIKQSKFTNERLHFKRIKVILETETENEY